MFPVFRYVGPHAIADGARDQPRGAAIRSLRDLEQHVATTPEAAREWLTFVVGCDGVLRLAPRRSEHVSCAGASEVLAAGELRLERTPRGFAVVEITNQSTGFCPDVTSWPAVAAALSRCGVTAPRTWTHGFTFRRCTACGELNLVKDAWFSCAHCDAELPREWNVSLPR